MLRVRLFYQLHGLTVFPDKHIVNWRSYSGLPCVSDRVKTVSGFLLFLTISVRLSVKFTVLRSSLIKICKTGGLMTVYHVF